MKLKQRFERVQRAYHSQLLGSSQALVPKVPMTPRQYADLHGFLLTDEQFEVMDALLKPPYKVLVKSGHNVGKSYLAAFAVNYWYDEYSDGVATTTAPTERDVKDILWAEVRLQRMQANLPMSFVGPSAPEMRTGPDHWAKGFTARKGESFQGRHRAKMLFVFDEAIGVERSYWIRTKTMFKPESGHAWLVIFNPTDATSTAYVEEQTGSWNVFTISSLDHPNIKAQLAGETPPIPAAVTVPQVEGWIHDWCMPISKEEFRATDLEWRGSYYRPGPEFESRVLGVWPTQGVYSIWSELLWQSIIRGSGNVLDWKLDPTIGVDVARFGDDDTSIHARLGNFSLRHIYRNGWRTTETVGQVIEWCRELAEETNSHRDRKAEPLKPEEIPILVDDTGVGGGVTDLLLEQGFAVIGVNSGTQAVDQDIYPNKRSELWFVTRDWAMDGNLDISRLDVGIQQKLKIEAMAPTYRLNSRGQREVEPKEVTKRKIGRSPDGLDAMNLAFCNTSELGPAIIDSPRRDIFPREGERRIGSGYGHVAGRAARRLGRQGRLRRD